MRSRSSIMIALAITAALASGDARAQARKPKADPPRKPAAAKPAEAQSIIAYAGATVHTGTGEVITDATVILEGGKISKVGKGLAPPAGASVIAAKGLVVTPGLTDLLTSIGLVEIDLERDARDDQQAGDDAIRAGFRAIDGYNPASSVIGVSRADGLTSAGVIPRGGLIAGLSLWADLDGATASEAVAASPLALHVNLHAGEKNRATSILRVREAFDDARAFQKNRAGWERNQSRKFAPSRLDLEALASCLDQKLPVIFHVNRAPEILAALAIAREFKLKPVIAGGAEAHRVAKELAAAKVPVIVFPFADPSSFDALAARDDNAALLHAAGVEVAIATGETHNARKLRQMAGNAVRAGLPHEAAIAAITRVPAEAVGLGARYGSIAPGKVANVVVWSADPLELSTQIVDVVIRGKRVTLKNRQSALLEKYRRIVR